MKSSANAESLQALKRSIGPPFDWIALPGEDGHPRFIPRVRLRAIVMAALRAPDAAAIWDGRDLWIWWGPFRGEAQRPSGIFRVVSHSFPIAPKLIPLPRSWGPSWAHKHWQAGRWVPSTRLISGCLRHTLKEYE